MGKVIFKLAPRSLWQAAIARGVFEGAPIDIEDGYIHFSTLDTVQETANKWFVDEHDVLLLAVEEAKLDQSKLKYEVSRGGKLFPHLYDHMPLDAVICVHEIQASNGQYEFSRILEAYQK